MLRPLLNLHYLLTAEQIEFYQTFNYIKLKHVLDAETLNYFNSVITSLVEENKNQRIDLDKRDTYGKAFLQEFNLWKRDQQVAELIFSKRLAQIATELMKCKGVRLYHDQALFKEAGGWIFHRAGANQSSEIRKVMTIIYMDSEMHANQPKNDSQWNDLRTWCPGVEPGNLINSELNPVLY